MAKKKPAPGQPGSPQYKRARKALIRLSKPAPGQPGSPQYERARQALLAMTGQAPGTPDSPAPKPPAAAAPAKPAPPVAPTRIDPFMNGGDLLAFNDFMTNFTGQLGNIDFELGNLQTDTTYQKGQTNTQAKEQTGSAQDAMIARGLFRSSIKDAAIYDIEAQRALHEKFLDDKMTAATLNAGTQKKLLGQSKERFDAAMTQRKVENATTANDAQSAAWAEKMAAYNEANPAAKPAAPKPATTPKPAAKPATSKPAPKPSARANTNQGSGNANAKPKRFKWSNGSMHTRAQR